MMASHSGLERSAAGALSLEDVGFGLHTAIMIAGKFSPFHDCDIWFVETLLEPADVVPIELLTCFARPNVIIVEAVESEVAPLLRELTPEFGPVLLVLHPRPHRLNIDVTIGIHRHIPFEMDHSRVRPRIDLQHARPDGDGISDPGLAEMTFRHLGIAEIGLEDRHRPLAEQVEHAL